MKLNNFEIPKYLLKFFEKKEYAEDFLNGKIYLKESGYFRKLEDNFRGDVNDGVKPIDMTGETIFLESPNEGIKLPINNIINFTESFEGDEKVPIFCSSLMDDSILEEIDDTSCKYRDEFLEELKKFGQYVAIISYDEFMNKIRSKMKSDNKELAALCSKVDYVNIMNKYNFTGSNNCSDVEERYKHFFKKDESYKWQNEFRLLLLSKNENKLIDNENDSFILEVGEFKYALITTADTLNGIIKVENIKNK